MVCKYQPTYIQKIQQVLEHVDVVKFSGKRGITARITAQIMKSFSFFLINRDSIWKNFSSEKLNIKTSNRLVALFTWAGMFSVQIATTQYSVLSRKCSFTLNVNNIIQETLFALLILKHSLARIFFHQILTDIMQNLCLDISCCINNATAHVENVLCKGLSILQSFKDPNQHV